MPKLICSPKAHERRWQQVLETVDEGPHACVENWLLNYERLAEEMLTDAMLTQFFYETKLLAFSQLKYQLYEIKKGGYFSGVLDNNEKETFRHDISALFPEQATFMYTRACSAPVNALASSEEGKVCVDGAAAALGKMMARKDIYEGQSTTIQTKTGPRTNFAELPFLGRLNELVKATKESTEAKTRLDKVLFIEKIAGQSHSGGGTVIDACVDRGTPYLPIELAALTREVLECIRNDKISENEGIN